MASFIAFVCVTWRLSEEERGYYLTNDQQDSIARFKETRSADSLFSMICAFWCSKVSFHGCHATQRWIMTWCSDEKERLLGPDKVGPFLAGLQWVIRLAFFSEATRHNEPRDVHQKVIEDTAIWLREGTTDSVFAWLRGILRLTRKFGTFWHRQGLFKRTSPAGFGFGAEMVQLEKLKVYIRDLEKDVYNNFDILLQFFDFTEEDLPLDEIRDRCTVTDVAHSIVDSYDDSAFERLQFKILSGGNDSQSCASLLNGCIRV